MKKALNISSVFILGILLLASCNSLNTIIGSDEINEKSYDFSGFNSLDISHSFNVEIFQSDEYKVIVTYNNNLEEYMEVTNQDKNLKIGLAGRNNYGKTKLTAKVYLPSLKSLEASGACNLQMDKFITDNLEIKLSGASKFIGFLTNKNNLTVETSGASKIELEGTSENADIELSGASNFKGKSLVVENKLAIDCSGASKLAITANGDITSKISGASHLDYYGTGTISDSKISGASSVQKH